MIEKMLWIVPSRQRPEKLQRFLESWRKTTTGFSDMLVVLDSDDSSCDFLYTLYPEVMFKKDPPKGESFLRILNDNAIKYCDEYRYIGFNEDDAIFHTRGYEEEFLKKLRELGDNGIVYANDLINKKGRIYFPVMHSSIIKRLGYMVPKSLTCMFADDFWRDLGVKLNSVYRFDNIIIQHLHYTRDNGHADKISRIVDSNKLRDKLAYEEYLKTEFENDLEKLKI